MGIYIYFCLKYVLLATFIIMVMGCHKEHDQSESESANSPVNQVQDNSTILNEKFVAASIVKSDDSVWKVMQTIGSQDEISALQRKINLSTDLFDEIYSTPDIEAVLVIATEQNNPQYFGGGVTIEMLPVRGGRVEIDGVNIAIKKIFSEIQDHQRK